MKWIMPEGEVDDIVAYLLEQRGITNKEKFFNPQPRDLYDPFLMHGMHDAVEAIIQAIKDNKKIFIHGDFDVDGVTATTIMWRFLYRELGANALPYIPSRFEEGYGLSDESLQAIIKEGGEIVISVDCGVKDIKKVNKYSDNLEFIITDHHTLLDAHEAKGFKYTKKVGEHAVSSKALAVVHPRLGDPYPFGELCGAAVAWKLCTALNTELDTEVDIMKYADLAAFGTVCDVMPLVDENRTIVSLGLEQISKTEHVGLRALAEVAESRIEDIDEYGFGYRLGPRINAAGRLEHALDAVKLLSTDNVDHAKQIAQKLQSLNTERQELTQQYLELAEAQVEAQQDDLLYFISGEQWPEGILGLIAGRLTQKYARPVLVGSFNGEHVKGSARSLPIFDIAMAFKELDEHLVAHGGHVQAAGFTVEQDNKDVFISKLKELIHEYIEPNDLVNYLEIDAVLSPYSITKESIHALESFSPFGMSNPKPIFALQNAEVVKQRIFGRDNSHIELIVKKGSTTLPIVAFGQAEELKDLSGKVHVAGSLYINNYNGVASMKLVDLKKV